MAAWDIPFVISSADLASFHSEHFPDAPVPAEALESLESTVPDTQVDEDDWLGSYPDGTRRTLTDDEIAIFRHSEIQALVRKRRLENEGETGSKADGEKPKPASDEPSRPKAEAVVPAPGRPNRKRKHNQTQRKARKRTGYEDQGDPEGRTFRRIAREMDELNAEAVDLDY